MLDYEKAYKEAIEKLKNLQKSWSSTQNRAAKEIEEAFPELNESEDERIVREILETLHYGLACEESVLMPGATTTLKEAIDYLERQKEQKPAINIEHLKSYMLQYLQDAANRKDDSEIEADTDKWAKMIINAFGLSQTLENYKISDERATAKMEGILEGRQDVINNPEKYCLQKPAEWSEDIIRKAIEEVGLTQHQINWFKNNVFPPKQEWSEKDKVMLNNIIWAIHMKSISHLDEMDDRSKYKKYEDFLNALPERFNLQPKQESEPIEIKYAGKIYKVYGTKELPGGVGYIIEDEPGHYDCIIHPDEVLGGGYGIKSNGSPYPTKEITFDEQPAGWSEEDEYTLEDAITAVDMMLTDSFQDSHPNLFKALLIAKDFLKSLPERFNLPPKQEWNEKDKHRLQQAINALDRSGYPVLVDWFKSLPERFNLQPNWKPSEEQMWALDVALENFYHKDDRAALESLRTDLKNYFSHEIH